MGVFFYNKWFGGVWAPQCMRMNIALLELYPIYVALVIWGDQLKDKCIQLNTDNMAVVHILNNFTSKDSNIMVLVRLLVLHCIKFNILIRSRHLPGISNVTSDLISRQQVAKALKLNPHLEKEPEIIPENLQLQKLIPI